MYNIISTGSIGNAVLYNNSILVDIGVPFDSIKPYLYDIQIVLLTHQHFSDHLNLSTLEKLQFERPSLRIGCPEWMYQYVKHLKNIDVYEIGEWYNYGPFKISSVKLYHDVPNIGFRIFIGDYKIIHCTDTYTLEGIEAKDYNLYAIEHNYDAETIEKVIQEKESNGEFIYQRRSIETHLSEQQARDFIYKNKGPNSEVIRLHESKSN